MEYELRNLTSKDIYPVTKIISKIGFKEFKQVFESDTVRGMAANGEVAESVGLAIVIDLAGIVLANLSSCEKEINEFLSSVTGLNTEEINKIPMAEYMQLIIDIVQKEEFKDFFKVVSKLLK